MDEEKNDWIPLAEAAALLGRPKHVVLYWANHGYLSRTPPGLGRTAAWVSRQEVERLAAAGGPAFRPRRENPYLYTPTPLECAYLAGLVDGEGHITIRLQYTGRCSAAGHWSVYCQVSNTRREVLDWIAVRFGGKVYGLRREQEGWAGCYDWKIHCTQALHVLRFIEPFMIVKQPQARLAIAFQEAHQAAAITGHRLTEAEIAARHRMREEMFALNKRGPRD